MTGIGWELLDRYLARQCSAAERELVERWMAASPANRRYVEGLVHVLGSNDVSVSAERKGELWSALDAARAGKMVPPLWRRRWPAAPAMAVAAVVVIAAAVAGRALFLSGEFSWRRHAKPVPMRVVTTPRGQRATFQLPDGSRVMLDVASTLRHPVTFGGGAREVVLEGEAYFEVTHDERHPFTVRAGDVIAKDLGTEFIVRAYPEDRHARVVVRAGKVALRAAAAPDSALVSGGVLQPGQLGRLAPDGTPIIEPVDTAAYFAWTAGRLVFDGVPLRDALPQLNRWFDLEFRLADSSLGDVPLTATLKTQPTPDVLDLVARSLGMRQTRNGRTVTFHSATDRR